MKRHYTKERSGACDGFTLIETLVYVSLYAMIFGGMLASMYTLVESDARNETVAMMEEEGNYLIGKIDAAVLHAASVQSPAESGTALSVLVAGGSSIRITERDSSMRLQMDGSAAETLNNTDVSVQNLNFVHTLPTGDGSNPESVSVSFTLVATTSDGHLLSQEFSTLEYVRI